MKNFQTRKNNRILYQLPFIGILFVVLVFFAISVVGFAKRSEEAYENRKVSEKKIDELKARKAGLEKDISELNTDFGKEKVFRENYGLGRPGEGVVVVVDKPISNETQDEKSWFMHFWRNLFGN